MKSGQIPLWLPQSGHSRFDNFQVESGSSNALLIQNLRNYVLKAETTPFFIYGDSGAGKTHLHIAAANLSRELGNLNTSYLDCNSASANHEILAAFTDYNCLCLDNIDAWAGNSEAEKALFSVVEKAKNTQQRLVVSAKKMPKKNAFALADLVSRLESGLVFELLMLDDEGKLKALQQNLDERNLNVDGKVLQYLLVHFARDNHSLFSALDKLDSASLIEKRKLTIPFVQQVLSG